MSTTLMYSVFNISSVKDQHEKQEYLDTFVCAHVINVCMKDVTCFSISVHSQASLALCTRLSWLKGRHIPPLKLWQ